MRTGVRRWAGRGLAALLVLALAGPAWVALRGLAQGRDLAARWRSLRAPSPRVAATAETLAPAPFAPARFAGSLLDPELVEVSGLAGSRRGADVLWAANDGGNAPRLYALGAEGRLLRAFDLALPEDEAENADVEALASFRHGGVPYLLVADVGDNEGWRRSVLLHVFEEPELGAPAAPLAPRARIELRYADGARDCEAVAVDEATATVLLIAKRTAPPILYAAELAPSLAAGGGEVVAQPLGPVRVPPPSTERADALAPSMLHMPTALDLEPGGAAAFVLTYAAGFRFPRAVGESWAAALARAPQQLALPPLALAEAAAYHDGALFVTSEIDRLALVRWRAPLVRFDRAASPDS